MGNSLSNSEYFLNGVIDVGLVFIVKNTVHKDLRACVVDVRDGLYVLELGDGRVIEVIEEDVRLLLGE